MATATKKKAPKKDTMRSRRQRSVVESNGKAARNRITDHLAKETKPKPESVDLHEMDIREFDIPIKGTTPLIVHQFSAKQRKQIEDKQQQKAKGGRGKRDPHAEYLESMYVMPGTGKAGSKTAKYGVPSAGFKKAAISACRFIQGTPMTFAKGAFYVNKGQRLTLITHDKKSPHMREDTVRIANDTLDLRYRAEFTEWSCVLRITYNHSCISPEQIVNMLNHAGFHVGICELRAEKSGDDSGLFEVVAGKKTRKK